MTRLNPALLAAGIAALGLAAAPARAADPSPPPPKKSRKAKKDVRPSAGATPAAAAPAAVPAAEPAGAEDPRDQQIRELREIVDQLRKRVDDLEKRPGTPAPETPPGTPPETPAPEPQPATETPPAAPQGGGATFLPNISAIGNVVLGVGDTKRVPNRGRFNFTEFELAFQDAVSPKLRYDVFLAAAKEEGWGVGLEEGFVTATAISPGLNARLGRIRTPFGKFNALHPHSWPFVTQPSAVTAFLGPEGLNADGAVAEYTFPTKGFFLRGELGAWQTASEAEDGLGFGGGDLGAYSGRLWIGPDLGRDRELELGISRYQGRGDTDAFGRRRKDLTGVDLTYRAYPGGYKRLLASAEVFNHRTSLPGPDANRLGGFAYLTYRPSQFWEWGVRGDYTKFPYPVKGYDWGGSLWLTRRLTEQTSLRLEYQYTRSPLLGTGNGLYFQLLFGSGPHTHSLQ
jgi:hypothetical protein